MSLSIAPDVKTADPCPCGSGKHFETCCGAPVMRSVRGADPRSAQRVTEAREMLKQGRLAGAEEMLRVVLADDPVHIGALRALVDVRRRAGNLTAVDTLLTRLYQLAPDNDGVLFDCGARLYAQGRTDDAHTLLLRAVEKNPRHAHAHYLLGLTKTFCDTLERAEYHLHQAHYLQPANPEYSVKLANVLRTMGRREEAERLLRITLSLAPDNLEALLSWSRLAEALNDLERAWELQRLAEALAPTNPQVLVNAAVLHRRDKAYELALASLDRVDVNATPIGTRIALGFERGRTLDAMSRYNEAFAAFVGANRLVRQLPQRQHPAEKIAERFQRLKSYFTREHLGTLPRGHSEGADEPRPIFIVGFPRSGTSMVEQILSAHPRICAGDELILLQRLTERAPQWLNSPQPFPECLDALTQAQYRNALQRFRRYYLTEVRTLAILDPGVRRFTDKMPLNEVHLGMLALAFPEAPVIHLLRHPLDVILSGLTNDMRHGDDYSADLHDAANHYVRVMDLVEHYRAELDLNYLTLRYEELVADVEGNTHRMLDFLGEPFDPRCVDFHLNTRYARTASYAQVTEKVYTKSIYRYRNYLDQLAPIIPVIAPVAARLGYEI